MRRSKRLDEVCFLKELAHQTLANDSECLCSRLRVDSSGQVAEEGTLGWRMLLQHVFELFAEVYA